MQKFSLKPLFTISCMAVLFFGFYTPETAASIPVSLLKGQLPVPGSSETAGFLPTSMHGVLLENQEVRLTWEEDGNLTLRFYDREILWSSNTSGKGATLYFMQSDGRLLIKDQNNNQIWSAGTTGGNKLWLQSNRNLVLVSSTDQTVWQSGTTINSLQTEGLRKIGAIGKPEDFMVPNTNYKYITIHTEGADGGKKQVKEAWGTTRFTVKAGSGATIVGTYEIGTGDNQIPPGSFIRVFVGQKGYTRTGQTTAGGDGGGGTGVLVKRVNESEWRLLQVAGGGGGAYSDCCSVKREGKSAETGRDGGDGGGPGASGGTNGMNGDEKLGGEGGGGTFDNVRCMWKGGDSDPTILPGMDDNDYNYGAQNDWDGNKMYGQFGFGIGGHGDIAGSGGGGYSGGGGGRGYYPGGGGGSYLNTEKMAIHNIVKIKNGTTSDTQDGYIQYQFSNSAPDGGIHFAYNTGKCIDDYGSRTDNGTNIQTYNCTGNTNQKWYIHPSKRSIHSMLDLNKCLDLTGGNTNNGTNIQLWDCVGGTANQLWLYNGIHKTIHSGKNSDKCFDATNGSANPNPNVNVQLWDCNYTSNNMKWTIDGAATVSNPAGKNYIIPDAASGYAVYSHTGAESGSYIGLWTKDNYTSEQWYFDGLAIKLWSNRNLCIDLKGGDTSNGNGIQLYNCNGTNAQKWIYDGMTQTIRSVIDPDKCMQIEKNTDGVYAKRSYVLIQDCNGSDVQLFKIQE